VKNARAERILAAQSEKRPRKVNFARAERKSVRAERILAAQSENTPRKVNFSRAEWI